MHHFEKKKTILNRDVFLACILIDYFLIFEVNISNHFESVLAGIISRGYTKIVQNEYNNLTRKTIIKWQQ